MIEFLMNATLHAAWPFESLAILLFGVTQAHRFLTCLAGDSLVTFQTFSDRNELKVKLPNGRRYDPHAKWMHGALVQHQRTLEHLNRQGAGVFVMVNAGSGEGRNAKSVQWVRTLFLDSDGKPLPEKTPLEPHLIVQSSPSKYHMYWRVDGLELTDFAPLQKALAEHYGTDPSVHDLPRVMRLPGFYHRKGEPVQVDLLEASDHDPYSREEVLFAWPRLGQRLEREAAERVASERRFQEARARAEARRLNPPTAGEAERERKRALAVLEGHCKTVASTTEGSRNDTVYTAAYTLGGYVAGGYLEADEVEDVLLAAAVMCGLSESEAGELIPRALEKGRESPLELTKNADEAARFSSAKKSKRARLAGWYA